MRHVRLNIEGLQEGKTQEKVKKQLQNLNGIQEVSLSSGQNYVDINYDDETSIEEINSHLQNNGYKIMNRS